MERIGMLRGREYKRSAWGIMWRDDDNGDCDDDDVDDGDDNGDNDDNGFDVVRAHASTIILQSIHHSSYISKVKEHCCSKIQYVARYVKTSKSVFPAQPQATSL